ncbi:glutamate receptor ionotropic, kainate 2-like isoform X1 [Galleria mellonella]|uniref:Glutamate receptor ionotropic, kainate 2-like isoform X1 n=1 Tax=Galleria mellonella TaxID=7137 RepID=A0A6J3C459_GALME|nr:glutamate receptor ionotropic, kainate 2-like isoform X1 [Galleria mellonella]
MAASRWLTLVAVLLSPAGTRADVDIRIGVGVVEADPRRAQQLAAAVDAALGAAAGGSAVAPVEPDEPLALPAHVCEQGAREAAALVCGGGRRAARLAGEGAARAGVPLLLLGPAPLPPTWDALALHPHPDIFIQVCRDLCVEKSWERAVLLYEGSAHYAAQLAPDADQLTLVPRQLPPPGDDALLRNLLLLLKKSGSTNFIVWCETAERALLVLDAAQRVGLLSERHSYIVLTLDLHTQPLANYSHGGANITTLQLFDPESPEVVRIMEAWRDAYVSRLGGEVPQDELEEVMSAPPTALLLAYDGARLVASALERLQLHSIGGGGCEHGLGAFHADTLLNYIRSEEWNASVSVCGGGAAWERDGGRREVTLRVAELQRGGRLARAGRWAPATRLAWQRPSGPRDPPPAELSVANRSFTILIAPNQPYVMRQESPQRLSGNDRYEGFCVELISKLAELLNFTYTLVEQPDGKYGSPTNVSGEWDGMLGQLMRDPKIDFAITDLTITAEREKAVDFSTPFMNLGISILFRKPKTPEPELFAFLLPFSREVWICLGFAYLGTSLLLYVVGRLCPEEWQNPYPCLEEPLALENQFTLENALWFNLGAVLLQGSEIAPVAYGTRAVASAWWLFALVITSSYTANLATLLAHKSNNELIHNVQDLADNDLGITYGAKINGSTYMFFQHSQNELYQRMFQHMSEHDMPGDNGAGIQKVMNEDFAFLMESTSIEYTIQRNCDVTMVGSLLDSKGYGIAMKKNSPYRHQLNLALLNLQEAGVLREMKHKWWNEKHGGGACNVGDDPSSEELKMTNFLGLFVILVVGSALGIIVSCCDLIWAAWRHPRDPNEPFSRRFWAEIRFVFRFEQSEKPLKGTLCTSSSESSPRSESVTQESEELSPEEERQRLERLASLQSAESAAAGGGGGGAPVMSGGPRARRRSSMHTASMRLARHAARNSATPAPAPAPAPAHRERERQ